VVSTVAEEPASDPMSEIIISIDGNTGTSMAVSGDKVEVLFNNLEIPATQGKGKSTFSWDVSNDQGQSLTSGKYYIKIEQLDQYGHVDTYVDDITVVQRDEYVELRVFNSAGEMVSVNRDYSKELAGNIKLDVPHLMMIEKDEAAPNFAIGYGEGLGEVMYWDARDNSGRLVGTGSYEVQVVVKTDEGYIYEASKSVMVLREDKEFLEETKIYPNPYRGGENAGPAAFAWSSGGETGTIKIMVYNMAGELVKTIEEDIAAENASWDLTNNYGDRVSSGFYVVIFKAVNSDGHMNTARNKFAVMGYPE